MPGRFACFVGVAAFSLISAISAYAEDKPKIEIVSQIGHSNIIQSVAFSPNGKQALSGGLDNTIKLWDVNSGRLCFGPSVATRQRETAERFCRRFERCQHGRVFLGRKQVAHGRRL